MTTPPTTCTLCPRPPFEHALFQPGKALCAVHYAQWVIRPKGKSRLPAAYREWLTRRNDSNATVLGDERTEWSDDNA